MARRNNKPPKQSLGDFLNELSNNEEYGYKQLRERLAVEREARAANAMEEGEPEGFLSSAPSDIPEEQATAQAPQEEQGWWGGVVNDAALSLRTGARQLTSGVLGAPVNVANLVTNPLPLRASQWVANRFSPEEESTQGINTVMDSLRISQPEAIRGTQEMIAQETLADQAEYSSATLTEARAKYEDAKGFLDTAKVLATQPRLTSAMALEVIPQLLVRTPGSVAGTVAGQAALAGSMVETEVAADLAKKVAAGEITREQAERTASNAFAFSAGVNAVLPSLHGGGMAIERALAGQGSRRTVSGIVSDVVAEGALGGLAEASDEIITNVSTDKPWDENVARSFVTGAVLEGGMAAPVSTLGAMDASRRAEVEESSRFNNSIDQAIIEQGNAMLAAREAEQATADAQVNTARLQRAEEAIRQNEQNKNNAWANASTPDMFGADPDIVGTFEEQEALRRYEDERRALSLQERRRAFEAAEQARAADEAAYGDVVQASRDAQFDARDEERARVAATQESIDPAFNPPVESQMASQLRAALSNRGVQPAVVEEVVQEVTTPADGPVDVMASKDGRDYRYTLTTDGNVASYDGASNITEGREVWNPKSQEASDAASAVTRGMLSLANNEVEGRAAYAAAIKEIVAADTEGRPTKFSMVMREGRGRFEGQQFPSTVVAPAVGVDGTQRIYEYVLSPDKHLRRTYRDESGIAVDDEYLATNKETGSREWSANPPGILAPGMEWGPAVDITTAGEEITAQANNLRPVPTSAAPVAPMAADVSTEQAPAPSTAQTADSVNGFIGPARGRRTEPNVGESRTTRIDESDPLPFPAMQRSAGTVREDAPVAEDVVQEQLELPGMDVVQPEQTTDAALQAARKKREDRIKKEKSEALKKAKAAYAKDREKFLDDLLERGLTPAQERKQLQDWMDNNPMPTEDTVTVAPAKPKTAAAKTDTSTPEAKADKALEDQRKRDVAAWRRGETTAANKAAAEAKMRKLNDKDSRALIAQRVKSYRDANPNPAEIDAAPDLPENAVIADNDPRIDEQVAAMRLFDTTSTDEELREQAKQDISNTILNQDMSPSNRIPEEERATLEDVRKLLGIPADKAGRSVRRAIGNGTVQLVTDQTAASYREDVATSTVAWYDGKKMYVNVSRLNKNNLKGGLLGAVGHEGKHSADASGKGKKGIAHFIGVEANKILRKRIEEAASRGDVAARVAVAKATAAAEARPDLPGLYEVELPAYYITETADRPTTLFRGMVSALRVGAKDLLGIKDININDVKYMAEKMVDNLSYETEVSGDITALLNQQAGIDPEAATVNQEDTVLNQDEDTDIPDRYNPRPNESISRSAVARFRDRGADLVKGMLFAGGGLSREANSALQDSVGEAAHYAAQAQKSAWQLDRGIAKFAEKRGMTFEEANSYVAERMAALESIPSPARREAALSNLVAANPELAPMLDMYRTIAAASNTLANNVLARRPLTESDRQFAQNLKNSAFAYTTRIYTSRQGRAGESISRKMLRTASKASKKLSEGKTLTRQEQEAYSIYNDAATYLMERLAIPEVETMLGMRQTRINELFNTWVDMDADKYRQAAYDDAIRDGADERTAKELARTAMIEELDAVRDISKVETVLNDKADTVIKSLLGLEASTPTATMLGGLREDRGILQKREDIPPQLRRLMGEVTSSPSIMLAVTMAKQGELIAREKFLSGLVDEGVVVPQNIAGTGIFSDYTVKLRGDTAGALQDMVTTPAIARIINAQLEMYSTVTDAAAISFMQGDAMLAALARTGIAGISKIAGSAKFMSVVVSPFAMLMNAAGSFLMLLPNGVYNPRMAVDAITAAKDSVVNTFTEGGSYSDVLANAVRWNVVDSARLQELRRGVNDALKDKVVNPSKVNKALHNAKRSVGAVTETFAMTDAWTKVAAFIKQQDYLTKYYEAEGVDKTADEISSEAAQIVRDTNFTYSKVPPIIRNVFERSGLTMFATYFWSVPQAITGNYIQAVRDVKRAKESTTAKGRALALESAITRTLGTSTALAAAPLLSTMLAQALNGMGDEDEDKIRAMADMMRDEQPYADPVYLGKDKDGNPLFFLLNRVDPYGPVTDLVRILGNGQLSDEQKFDEMTSLISGMAFHNSALVEAAKVVTSEERGNTSTRLERLPVVGTAVRDLQGLVGYADWARSLTTLADRTLIPGAVNVLDPENPTVAAGDYNSNVAAILGMVTLVSGGKAIKANPSATLRSYGFELKEKRDSARKRVALAIANDDSPERIADMIISESEDMFHDFERVQRTYDGMVNGMDMSPRAAAAVLKSREGAGLNEVQVGLIRRGLLRGDREMALELAGLLSKKSVEDRVARTRGSKDDKEEVVSQSREALRILRQDYGLKVGE